MELRQLQFFVAVAERLNFSRAAEALYISQPSLSYQIAELERELGVELFMRDRRRVALSPAGALLLEPSRELLAVSERIRNIAGEIARNGAGPDAGSGRLRVGFDSTEDHFECIGRTDALARFSSLFPGVDLDCRQQDFDLCTRGLLDGELDVAFLTLRHNEHVDAGLAVETIQEDRLELVYREESREGAAEPDCEELLARFDLLLVAAKPRGRSRLLAALEAYRPRIRTVDSLPASFTLTQSGKGVMVLPRNYLWHHGYRGLRSVSIPGDAVRIEHCMVWNRNCLSPHVDRLLGEFRAARI